MEKFRFLISGEILANNATDANIQIQKYASQSTGTNVLWKVIPFNDSPVPLGDGLEVEQSEEGLGDE